MNRAHLEIPKANDKYEFSWRMKLIETHFDESENNCVLEDIITILESYSLGPIGFDEDPAFFNDFFKSSFFNLDEVELALLFASTTLRNLKNYSDSERQPIHQAIMIALSNEAHEKQNFKLVEQTPEEYASSKLQYYCINFLPKIRAKLACLELFASLLVPNSISKLISICPKYLGSRQTQQWLYYNQVQYRFSHNDKEVETASQEIEKFFKAFRGDKRKFKDRDYKYWNCTFRYDYLLEVIKKIRAIPEKLSADKIEIILDMYEIPKNMKDLVLQGPTTPANLALEIMIDQKLIHNEKSFREFQSYTSGLKERHPELITDKLFVSYLDYQFNHTKSFAETDIWLVLEDLKI